MSERDYVRTETSVVVINNITPDELAILFVPVNAGNADFSDASALYVNGESITGYRDYGDVEWDGSNFIISPTGDWVCVVSMGGQLVARIATSTDLLRNICIPVATASVVDGVVTPSSLDITSQMVSTPAFGDDRHGDLVCFNYNHSLASTSFTDITGRFGVHFAYGVGGPMIDFQLISDLLSVIESES